MHRRLNELHQEQAGVSSELAAPNTYMPSFNLDDVAAGKYGSRVYLWDWERHEIAQTVELGEQGAIGDGHACGKHDLVVVDHRLAAQRGATQSATVNPVRVVRVGHGAMIGDPLRSAPNGGNGLAGARATIVVPCFNEAARLRADAFRAFCARGGGVDLEVVHDRVHDRRP